VSLRIFWSGVASNLGMTLSITPVPLSSDPATAALPPPRLRRPDRTLVVPACPLDDLLPPNHRARLVWQLVGRWDLSRFLQTIRARGSRPGRAATDPRLLIALWLYATTQHVGGGRELARLCRTTTAYRWLCGGVSLNYHTLNQFRTGHATALDDLLTQMLAVLLHANVVHIDRVSQDGTRVRASAGSSSFHRRATLEEHLQRARVQVQALKDQADEQSSAQRRAARRRAAAQRQTRLEQALQELAELETAKAQQKAKPSKERPPRASSTDPEARLMRMPDGGTRPAYNVQFATDTHSRAVVGVAVTQAGSDAGQDERMRQSITQRTGLPVREQLTDGGYVSLEGIKQAATEGVTVYEPVPKPRKAGIDPHQPKRGDSAAVAAWRVRMGTEAAKEIYKERAATSETVNAEVKTYRGLGRLMVRGQAKVQCVALWAGLAYNLVHYALPLLGVM
jgi:transposase